MQYLIQRLLLLVNTQRIPERDLNSLLAPQHVKHDRTPGPFEAEPVPAAQLRWIRPDATS